MTCFRPVKGYYNISSEGKLHFRKDLKTTGWGVRASIPCGSCHGCLTKKRDDWAIRCVHEAKMHRDNCFITLTYTDESLPMYGSLVPHHFDKFLWRLQKHVGYGKFKYFMAGEYGTKGGRPHYHALIFGWKPDDMVWLEDSKCYASAELTELWKHGFTTLGEVTRASALYTAKYCMKNKKLYEDDDGLTRKYNAFSGELVTIESEYNQQTPGLGRKFLEKYWKDIYPHDEVIVLNSHTSQKLTPPRYYDEWLKQNHPAVYLEVKNKRWQNIDPDNPEHRENRLGAREWAKKLKASTLTKRKL